MNERSKVQNPLTIIAIFAGIAELAGTGVLIGLPIELQKTFMWFVMVFPVILVLSFFLILVFKNNVLYAPSDFSNDQYYVDLQKDTGQKISADLKDAKEIITEAKDITILSSNISDTGIVELKAAYEEKLNEIEKKIESAQTKNDELQTHENDKHIPYDYSKRKVMAALKAAGENGLSPFELCVKSKINTEKFNKVIPILIDEGRLHIKGNQIFIT